MDIKNITELTIKDLEQYPIWYLPGEEEFGDEFSIKPATEEIVRKGFGLIIKTYFFSLNEEKYTGFIHLQEPYSLDSLQPSVILKNNYILYFWKGMFLPDNKTFRIIKKNTPDNFYPLKFKSIEKYDLKSHEGIIEGLLYYDKKKKIQVKKY